MTRDIDLSDPKDLILFAIIIVGILTFSGINILGLQFSPLLGTLTILVLIVLLLADQGYLDEFFDRETDSSSGEISAEFEFPFEDEDGRIWSLAVDNYGDTVGVIVDDGIEGISVVDNYGNEGTLTKNGDLYYDVLTEDYRKESSQVHREEPSQTFQFPPSSPPSSPKKSSGPLSDELRNLIQFDRADEKCEHCRNRKHAAPMLEVRYSSFVKLRKDSGYTKGNVILLCPTCKDDYNGKSNTKILQKTLLEKVRRANAKLK